MILKVDKDKCIGCGVCVALSPLSFKWNADGNKAEPIIPHGEDEQTLKDTTASCPVEAIILE